MTLNAAHSEVCRFDWSEHDQADLDIVISEIKTLYIKAGSKVPSSQVTRDHNVSDVEESIGEDLGSRSSAKTSNPKASVSKSPWDEELEFRPSFPGKSA